MLASPAHRLPDGGLQRIVIVGAGQAGGCAAAALRANGFAGAITLVGAEPFPPYERPPLSKEVLAGGFDVRKTYLRPLSAYAELSVDLLLSRTATAIDRQTRRVDLDDGGSLTYDRLLLTTGARARLLPAAATTSRTHYVRDLADAERLEARLGPGLRLLIVGAGFVGLEVAATARQRGCNVVVIEAEAYPLARVLPPVLSDVFSVLHAAHGVDMRLGTSLVSVTETERELLAHLSTGATVAADEIIVGVGSIPNTALAEDAGLIVADGILTDEFCRTSDPDIFAAGDATRHFNPLLGRHIRLESWQNAQNQASHAARSMLGAVEPYRDVPWFWTHQYDLNFQLAGLPLAWDALVWRGNPGARGSIAFALDNEIPVAGASIGNARDMRHVKRLIASALPIDPHRLADLNQKLADLAVHELL